MWGPNPYTWFTMDALENTWGNLQKIIKVSVRCEKKWGWGGWMWGPILDLFHQPTEAEETC